MKVIADLNFNDSEKAKEYGMDIINYNKMIIENWNEVVGKDDTVIIFGKVGKPPRNSLIDILEQLNGIKEIANYSYNDWATRGEWKSWGIKWVLDVKYFSKKDRLFFSDTKENADDYDYYIVTAASNMEKVMEGNCISIEGKFWYFMPIDLDELPNIIERLKGDNE